MPKVDCLADEGELVFKFNSEDHLPRHFHVRHKGGEWEIRVYFETFDGSDFDYDYKFQSVLTKSKNPIKGRYKRIITKKLSVKGILEELIKEFDSKVILED